MSERSRVNATGLPAGSIDTTRSTLLSEGWTLLRSDPDEYASPGELPNDGGWSTASVPGTVASSMDARGLDAHPDYDAHDWWYRCEVPAPAGGRRVRLRLDGLATLAEVWLNDVRVLESSNMFLCHEVDVTDLLGESNELTIVFRSLGTALAERHPRPRWKTDLVESQHLRWFRTTLLGRIPGWTPAIRPVGPWRAVWLEVVEGLDVRELSVVTDLHDRTGIVRVDALVEAPDSDAAVEGATLQIAGTSAEVAVERRDGAWSVRGEVHVEEPALWWPRTHGEPTLHPCTVRIGTSEGDTTIDCGAVGFRSVEVDRTDGRVAFRVNGVPVFCRGACWTTNDIVSLAGDPNEMRRTLDLAARAHANMIRVGGTMVYETDEFYARCDELGLMVWQDFMFANMDYPVDDEAFAASAEAEAEQQLRRLGRHPSVVAYCGGSEVEQQAAMFGAPREIWTNDFFSETLPSLVERRTADAPYWTSTPTGGALPFHVGEGITHYYGVGAYRRPVEDARLSGVRFTPECLGFSNVPDAANLRKLTASGSVAPHHPAWKAGVPRDSGAGWDFEDIRDHYLERLYGLDAVALRSEDPPRYERLSRIVTGRLMQAVFEEWRSEASTCGGGLVWFLKDLRPGAGWGIIDSDNRPKGVYYFLKRAWSPFTVTMLDRGLDGLAIEIHNETSERVELHLELTVIQRGSAAAAKAAETLHVEPRGHARRSAEALLERFADPTYSYRFGKRRHDAVAVVVDVPSWDRRWTSVYWPSLGDLSGSGEVETELDLEPCRLTVTSDRLAQAVKVEAPGWTAQDDYVDLLPGVPYPIDFERSPDDPPPRRIFIEGDGLSAAHKVPRS